MKCRNFRFTPKHIFMCRKGLWQSKQYFTIFRTFLSKMPNIEQILFRNPKTNTTIGKEGCLNCEREKITPEIFASKI